MNTIDLMASLDSLPEEYILEASSWHKKQPSHPPLLLVAAIAAMVAMLAGCAVAYLLNLKDLQIGAYHDTRPRYTDENGNKVPETEVHRDLLSLQGIAGSPNYLAAQEWNDFLESYDPDKTLLRESEKSFKDFGAEYDAYSVYTQEMAEKVAKIAEKYDLELAGERLCAEDYQQTIFLDALGLDDLWKNGAPVSYRFGYFYECGNFSAELEITLGNVPVLGTFRYNRKAHFDVMLTAVNDVENCQTWTIALDDGQQVLIAMDEEFVRIFCDREDGFLSFQCFRQNLDKNGNPVTLAKEDVWQIVSWLNFSAITKKPDMAQARQQLETSLAEHKQAEKAKNESPFAHNYHGYDDVIRNILENGAEIYYALADITGDGTPELLLGTETGFGTVKTMADGHVETLLSNGMDRGFELCQGNIIRSTAGDSIFFMKLDDATGQFQTFLEVGYDPWEESWYRREADTTETLSREAYAALLEAYPVLDIGMMPVGSYPLT